MLSTSYTPIADGNSRYNEDMRTHGDDKKHDGMPHSPSFASFLHMETRLEGDLEHCPRLIHNASFIMKKWTPGSKLSEEELNSGGTSNDGFQTVQRKTFHDPFNSKHGTGGFTSPYHFDILTKEDGKCILRDLQESNEDVDVDNGFAKTYAFVASKSLANSTGGST
ncbi:hypothetical protein Tco_1007748 [Tanacetum coccineum]